MIDLRNKLNGLPPIFCISTEHSMQRRTNLYRQLKNNNLHNNIHFNIFPKFSDCQYILNGRHVNVLHECSKGPVTSHIKTNAYWTRYTNHPYVLILEDDTLLEIAQYWGFTWQEFFNNLPKDWECVQLCILREFNKDIEFRLKDRYNHDLGCQAYLIKRNYAEKMVDRYLIDDNTFNLDMPITEIKFDANSSDFVDLFPIVEHIVFETLGKTYSCPLFLEDMERTKTSLDINSEDFRIKCYNHIYNWWQTNGPNTDIKTFFR